jgi:alpha-D-ribose 1-methylphosphonate 5-triphosphate synthase subunit PhnG
MTAQPAADPAVAVRQHRQRILALTPCGELERRWQTLGFVGRYRLLRGPEIGLALLRGRIGGSGNAFNLGEMTLARASVALEDGQIGHGWVAGRDKRHAELIAVIDACAQLDGWREAIDDRLVAPLARQLDDRRTAAARQAAATRVDFFTLVRGE